MSQKRPQLKRIPVDKLHFDPLNPRIPAEKRAGEEEAVFSWMLKSGNLIELMESIASTGYSEAEPVLAVQRADGEYIVVEGNRRLAATKLLLHPAKAPLRKKSVGDVVAAAKEVPEEIPVLLYKKRDDILDYLGYRHITGVKAWGPDAKAAYLRQLFERHLQENGGNEAKTFGHIARMAGTNAAYARRQLTTLAIVDLAEEEAFWQSEELEQGDIDFSVLGTALTYSGIVDFLGLKGAGEWKLAGIDQQRTKELLEWIFGSRRKVADSRKLKTLNNVVQSKEALKQLRQGKDLEEAALHSGEAYANFVDFVRRAGAFLDDADRLVSSINEFSKEDFDTIRRLNKLAVKIGRAVEDVLKPSDDFQTLD